MQAETQIKAGRVDFDFLMGQWKVSNRRLRERLAGSTSWEEFECVLTARKILNGLGNIDELTMERETGVVYGFTMRLFNPATQEWSIYWADSVNPPAMNLPQIGKFDGDRGEFYAHEPFKGKYIFSRFIWTVINEDRCRWEQAFSEDGGTTWETNWINEFERLTSNE